MQPQRKFIAGGVFSQRPTSSLVENGTGIKILANHLLHNILYNSFLSRTSNSVFWSLYGERPANAEAQQFAGHCTRFRILSIGSRSGFDLASISRHRISEPFRLLPRSIVGGFKTSTRAGTTEQLRDIVSPDQYRIAFIQSTDLIEVWNAFEGRGGARFNQKLRSAVSGPDNPIYEKSSSSNARDLLFELSVAAFFRRRKTLVLVGTNKDVVLKLGGFTLFAECKRPKSKTKVERAIRKATGQLLGHFACDRREVSPRGFIVLDISVLANPQYTVINGSSIDTISRRMDSMIADFFDEHSKSLEYRPDQRILGILGFVKALAFLTGANRHLDCQKVGMFSHAQPRTLAGSLADELYQRLSLPVGDTAV